MVGKIKDRYYDLLTKAIIASFCIGAMAGFALVWFVILIGE